MLRSIVRGSQPAMAGSLELIVILRGCDAGFFGTEMESTPFWNVARMAFPSTCSGRRKLRSNAPLTHSAV